MSVPLSTHLTNAIRSLKARSQRTLLALIGIAIGIGSVTALTSTGTIARAESLRQFETLGTDILTVFGFNLENNRSSMRSQFGLTRKDITGFPSLPSVDAVAPYRVYSEELHGSGLRQRVQVVGTTSAIAAMLNLNLDAGRFLSPLDGNRPFAVIGSTIKQRFLEVGVNVDVGSRIKLGNSLFTVVGILEQKPRRTISLRPNETVFAPIGHVQRKIATKQITGAVVRMQPDVHYLTATSEIEGHLARVAPHLEVRVDSPVGIIQQMESQMRLLAILLGSVGGISLIMGGFGVMNAMLASVTEQRLEIGIRRALGARRRDIQHQVLIESSILCLIGGVVGLLLGLCVTVGVSLAAGWVWQFSWGALLLGVLIAVAVGVFFGYYPARQASRLDPIVTLRMG